MLMVDAQTNSQLDNDTYGCIQLVDNKVVRSDYYSLIAVLKDFNEIHYLNHPLSEDTGGCFGMFFLYSKRMILLFYICIKNLTGETKYKVSRKYQSKRGLQYFDVISRWRSYLFVLFVLSSGSSVSRKTFST